MPRAKSRLMASPNPVPSLVRVSVASTCTTSGMASKRMVLPSVMQSAAKLT